MDRQSRIYVAGHRGLVGSAIYRCLTAEAFSNIITRTHAELDLARQGEVEVFSQQERPDYVFLAAAMVGGIWANTCYPAEFIYSNIAIQTNVIHASWNVGVKRLLFLGSSCIYPRECPQPMREEHILTGRLESTNQPYAVAKIAGIIQCEAYNRQYGTQFLAGMPTNLYGPNDNFDLETSHVLPALIRKFHLAKLAVQGNWGGIQKDEETFGRVPEEFMADLVAITEAHGHASPNSSQSRTPRTKSFANAPGVTLWGTGYPRRELLYVDELAAACLFLMNLSDDRFRALLSQEGSMPLINIGCGEDSSVRELADLVARIVGYEGEVTWDTSKPDGTPQKLLDISRLRSLGWSPRIGLQEGVELTYHWYLNHIK